MKYLIIFILLSITVTATCFTNPDSTLYCQDISQQQAEEECSLLDCSTEEYYQQSTCETLPECQDILCKSSCITDKKGQCLAGEIPLGEEQLWCSEGCCIFNYLDENFCDFTRTKWLCEVEAKNKHAPSIYYETNTKFGCTEICNQPLESRQQYLQGKQLELVSSTSSLFKSPPKKEIILKVEPPKEIPQETSNNVLLYLFLLIISIVIIVIFVHKYHFFTTSTPKPTESKSKWQGKVVPKKVNEQRINKIKQIHSRKYKKRQREGYLTEQGFPIVKSKSHVHKLQKILTREEQHKQRKAEAPIIFQKLRKISTKPKPKEDIIKKLRKIVK